MLRSEHRRNFYEPGKTGSGVGKHAWFAKIFAFMQDSLNFLRGKFLALEERMETKFATKEDLKAFATKDDLKSFATKDDLKRFATKEDLALIHDSIIRKVASKEELAAVNSNLISHIDGLAHRHERLDLEILAMRAKSDRLESHVQQLAKHTNLALE